MSDEPRPYTLGTEGRKDKAGTVWFACDPYPRWYRWDNGELITPDFGSPGSPNHYERVGTFPGWEKDDDS